MEDPETAAELRKKGWSLNDALNDFTGKTHASILDRGKVPVVWQEMVSLLLVLPWQLSPMKPGGYADGVGTGTW